MMKNYTRNLLFVFSVVLMLSALTGMDARASVIDDEKPKNELLDVKIYPNPVADKLTITFPEVPNKEISIKLVDITGRVAYSSILRDKREFNLDVTGYSKGLYILNFFDENGEVLKITKIQKL